MGLTAIKVLENRTSHPIAVRHIENPQAPGSGQRVPAEGSLNVDLSIPRATSAQEFAQKHILIEAPGNNLWIWQAAHDDGDFVRVANDGQWRDRGNTIDGDKTVDGDRRLVIAPGQNDSSFAWMSRTMRGGVNAERMLFNPIAPRVYRGELAQTGLVLTVRSLATFPVYLEQHAGDARRYIGPGETSTLFTGMAVPRQLYAVVPDHIALPLPSTFELEFTAWT